MKAMILAAGRGERMKPLTDDCPKPLLKVKGVALIEHHIKKLAQIGIKEVVINHAWLGEMIERYLTDGSQWQINISYSAEDPALETAGGIINALPLLGNKPFLLINSDVYTAFDFTKIPVLPDNKLAHLWLVKNPEHNLSGDFCIDDGLLQNKPIISEVGQKQKSYTYSGIAIFKPEFFQQDSFQPPGTSAIDKTSILPLAPMLRVAADQGHITASVLPYAWTDVGTPERLAQLNSLQLS
jgi:MurNAc alpha-1-phosphate uridylyltransferase